MHFASILIPGAVLSSQAIKSNDLATTSNANPTNNSKSPSSSSRTTEDQPFWWSFEYPEVMMGNSDDGEAKKEKGASSSSASSTPFFTMHSGIEHLILDSGDKPSSTSKFTLNEEEQQTHHHQPTKRGRGRPKKQPLPPPSPEDTSEAEENCGQDMEQIDDFLGYPTVNLNDIFPQPECINHANTIAPTNKDSSSSSSPNQKRWLGGTLDPNFFARMSQLSGYQPQGSPSDDYRMLKHVISFLPNTDSKNRPAPSYPEFDTLGRRIVNPFTLLTYLCLRIVDYYGIAALPENIGFYGKAGVASALPSSMTARDKEEMVETFFVNAINVVREANGDTDETIIDLKEAIQHYTDRLLVIQERSE